MKIYRASILFATFCLTCFCAAQSDNPWEFPNALRSQMDAQLQQFIQAQTEGHWDDVGRLLGKYRRGSSYMTYTSAHKHCLVEVMKASPMIFFNYQIQESPFSSEILMTPPNRRWWTLVGEAGFRTDSGVSTRQVGLVAYRDGEGWFFTPPPLDNARLSAEVTAQDLTADRKNAVEVHIPSDAPVEVVDLHVHINAQDFAARDVEFRFHNKTDKKITGYSFVLDDEKQDDSISVGTGAEEDAILPHSDSRVWTENHKLFLYRCEGEANIRITVKDVTFADGTTWQMITKRPAPDPNSPEGK
jgi:hypothetical protein